MVEVKKETLSVRVHISLEDIENLLDSAARGSDYWCENKLGFEEVVRNVLYLKTATTIKDFEGATEKNTSGEWIPIKHILNLGKIKKGLTVMAKKERSHFCDLINDNADMITGDVFLQCCLFGEVVYG